MTVELVIFQVIVCHAMLHPIDKWIIPADVSLSMDTTKMAAVLLLHLAILVVLLVLETAMPAAIHAVHQEYIIQAYVLCVQLL